MIFQSYKHPLSEGTATSPTIYRDDILRINSGAFVDGNSTISIVTDTLGNFGLTMLYQLSQGMLHAGHSKSSLARPHRAYVT